MFVVLVILIGLIAVLLCFAVLLQSGKGGGLAGIAAGGQAQQILGARQAPDFLEKATWTLGSSLLVLCLLASFFAGPDDARRSILQGSGAPAAPGTQAPGTSAPGTAAPGTQAPGALPPASTPAPNPAGNGASTPVPNASPATPAQPTPPPQGQ
ncbi:MAG TPA: preprotein translocase subunit SecG [Rubricoccaceae bacterium]|nr:preprotein translocase subunit SecG [Rubricoccaceae bacterium]